MSSKKNRARDRNFRTRWLPAALNVLPEEVADIPGSHLRELYGSVYFLGPRGLVAERQLNRIKTLYGNDPITINAFQQEFSRGKTQFARVQRRKNVSEKYRFLINPGITVRSLVTPDLPDVRAYLSDDERVDPDFWKMRKVDIESVLSIEAFISVSANITRLRKEPTVVDAVTNYEYYCQKYELPA